jgi:peptidoglycan-associated lipoprotein
MRNSTVAALLLIAIACAACGRKPRPAGPAPGEASPSQQTTTQPIISDDANRAAAAEETRRREEAARARVTLEQMVFFDYDRSNIRDDARTILDAKIPIMRAYPDVRIRIEGHADERGSVEYNLALSLRRAESVRSYLENFGISPSRMEIVGFGEERPLDVGGNEAAFARNRRSEFRIVTGLMTTN